MINPFILNPLAKISEVLLLFIIRRIGPAAIISSMSTVVTTLYSLVSSVGFFRTFQILLRVHQAINIRAVPSILKDIIFKGTNPIAAETIYRVLDPDWSKLIRNYIPVKKIIRITIVTFCTVLFLRPLVLWLIRFVFTCIITALGIIYTPTLKAIKHLR